jgi:hypothetical protein
MTEWVKTGNAQNEQIFSALAPLADAIQLYFWVVPFPEVRGPSRVRQTGVAFLIELPTERAEVP